ncbi:hypothetical protein [Clostridioides sp. ZZV14-6104]|nr:hypothetical protein [Clostridioides sp. ZZV14-6104]
MKINAVRIGNTVLQGVFLNIKNTTHNSVLCVIESFENTRFELVFYIN